MKSFAFITVILYELQKRDTPFAWGEQQQSAFEALKAVQTEAPLLMLPRPGEPYKMHTPQILPLALCCIRRMPLVARCAISALPTSPTSYLRFRGGT